MYALLSCQNLCVYLVRYGYPFLVPFIVAEHGWSEEQRAALLSAFSPGYLLTQIPGGMFAQVQPRLCSNSKASC
eukprot:SAG31_NODE_8689_length_1405_cov_6.761103_2_plen_74_part_00